MKYLFTLFLLVSFLLGTVKAYEPALKMSSLESTVEEKPEIKVKVEGFNSGTAYLIGVLTDQQYLLDTAIIDATGMAIFNDTKPYKEGIGYVLLPDNAFFQLLLGDDQVFQLSTNKGKLEDDMVVSGSKENELLYGNLKYESTYTLKYNGLKDQQNKLIPTDPEFEKLKLQMDQLVKERKQYLEEIFKANPYSFFTSFKRAGQNPDLLDFYLPDGQKDTVKQIYVYRQQFWDNVDFADDRLLSTPVIPNKLKRYITQLTPQNPDSIIKATSFLIDKVINHKEYYKYIVNWITLNYEPTKSSIMDADAIYVYMIQHYFTHERAFWSDTFELNYLQKKADEMSVSLIGVKGADVRAADPTGNFHAISELNSDYVIVYMFSPECSHCQEESPKLVEFYKEWKNKGVEIFAIGVNTNQQEWPSFVKAKGMDQFINVFDPTNKAIYKKYYVDNTPEIYILNKERVIIGKNIKVDQIAEIINKDRSK